MGLNLVLDIAWNPPNEGGCSNQHITSIIHINELDLLGLSNRPQSPACDTVFGGTVSKGGSLAFFCQKMEELDAITE